MWPTWTLLPASIAPFFIALAFARITSATYTQKFSVSKRKVPISRLVVLAIAVNIGILASVLADALEQLPQDTAVSVSGLVLHTLRRPRTLIAFLVSPLVFHSVYAQAKAEPDNVVALLLAFQNGFFWHSILDKAL